MRYSTKQSSIRLLILIVLFGASLFSYIDRENSLTAARLALDPVLREVKTLEEGNAVLSYQLSRFEAPSHLFEIAGEPAYGHLVPAEDQVWAVASPQEHMDQSDSLEHKMSRHLGHHIAASR